ncbi:PAS domain S-box protein [Marivirga salinae]|uniref:histidine kinase n=1 Tax=Marivirga salinarum TaxID=3059078 RepID=A0AA51RCR1_9BACT|nr:PAS domain S-box protein [Marivirga sp. BDSF4-3]WMN12078.1 PAS domain S-box protein [Marivirga sp. BDSF4-3]
MSKLNSENNNFLYFNPIPSWIYDLENFHVQDVNQAALDHYGYLREEFLNLNLTDLIPLTELEKVKKSHTELEEKDSNIFFGTIGHYKKNHELIQMEVSGLKIEYEGLNCMLVSCQDVTEKQNYIKRLKESEERLKAATAIANLGYWRLELDANTLSWTDEVYRIWGRERDSFELNYESFYQTIHPNDRRAFDEEQQDSFAGIKDHEIVHRILLPDGNIRWVHELGRLIKNEKGKPIAFEGTVQDVTQSKNEEQRLKLLESVVTNTNDAILITEAEPLDEPGPRIIYVNEAFTKMTGYSAEEVIGKTPRILQGPDSDKKELARLGKALRNWKSCEVTTLNYKKNGEEFWINFTISPVANENGWYTHWVAIERDVTEQKLKEIEKELLGRISLNFKIENDLTTSTKELCKTVNQFGKFDFVEIWIPNIENSKIQLIAKHVRTSFGNVFYKNSKAVKSTSIAEGLQGTVMQKRTSILWKDVNINEDFVRKEAAKKAGIETVLGIPLFFDKKVIGVLVIGTQNEISYLKKYVKIFEQFQKFIGSEISRKKLENDLSHLYQAVPDILCLADFKGRFQKMNKAGCHLLGYSEEEILYRNFVEFSHPEDQNILSNALTKLNKGKTSIKFENRYLSKNGSIIWLSWTCNSDVKEGLIYATAKNITEEKKLKELNRQANTLAKIGSWEIDVLQEKIFWSDMVHQLHETDSRTFVPQIDGVINFYREDFREMVKSCRDNCIEFGLDFDFEAILVTANKNERWVRAIGTAELIDGECKRLYGSFQDIHDQKEAEVRLQSLADNLPGVVFQYILLPDGTDTLKYVTNGAKQVWGFRPEEIVQNNELVWNQIKAGGNFDEVQKSIQESIRSKSKWTARWKYVLPSGEFRTHLGYGAPYFLSDGSISFNSVILDITQEAKNEELLEQATSMAKIGSWELEMVNQNEDSMYWSPMTKDILEVDDNYNPSLTGGFEFYVEESKQLIQKAVDELIKDGKEFDEELLIITGSGKEKWIRCIGKSERTQGSCVKIFGSFQDINKAKSLEFQISEILGSISDAFYALDNHWNFTYFNKAAERLLKLEAANVIGKSIWEIFPSSINTPLEKIYHQVTKTGTPETFEYYFPGDGKWYEINAYPSRTGLSSFFKNIDDRRKAAEDLRKAYEEKNTILESIGDAFIAIDKNWIVTYWNKAAEEFIGRKREEIIGENLWDVFPDAIDTVFYEQYHKAVETNESITFEEYYSTIGKWFDITAYPSDEGLTIYFKDISLRKEADIRLQKANERFEKVTEATNDAIWDWDIENNTFYRSEAIDNFFGNDTAKKLSEEEFWKDKFHPEDLDYVKETVNNCLNDPLCDRLETQYRVINAQNKIVFVKDRALIVRNSDGKAIRMLGAMTDITERKNFEQKLLELNSSLKKYTKELELSNEELEQFAYIASHDLQEPLRMVSSFMDLLSKKYEDSLDEKALQYIYFATDGAKRMKKIILDLLEYSRAGKFDAAPVKINMNKITEDYQVLRKKLIAEKNAVIKIDNLPTIQSYTAPLTQTIHSLMDNAIRYSKDDLKPRIRIFSQELDEYWQIGVEDNGIGIDPQFFDKIFVIFQRLHNKNKYTGTGVGLSIAKKHVESWGGKIWLESSVGKGSTFYFTIPKKSKNEKL